MNKNSKEITLDVEGMTCPSCMHHVNSALAEVQGVKKVEVRLRAGQVQVQLDSTIATVEMLLEALYEAGYDATPSVAA